MGGCHALNYSLFIGILLVLKWMNEQYGQTDIIPPMLSTYATQEFQKSF